MKFLRSISANSADRPDAFDLCAAHMLDFLKLLREHNPAVFSTWHGIGHAPDKEAALAKPLTWTHEGLQNEFTMPDAPQESAASPDRCFDLMLWNGRPRPEDLALFASLGGSSYTSKRRPNHCALLWSESSRAYTCYSHEGQWQEALIALFRDYWKPMFIRLEGLDGSLQKGLYTFFDEHEPNEEPLPEAMYKPPVT